jgi:adenosylcobinamide-GDP ribazoletransferase
LLVGKLVALQELVQRNRADACWLVAVAVVLARCLALCLAGLSRYPRPEGTGKALVSATRRWEVLLYAAVAGAAVLVVFPVADWKTGVVFLTPCLAVLALTWICRRRLGGVTGDCLGAAIESAELVFLLTGVLI